MLKAEYGYSLRHNEVCNTSGYLGKLGPAGVRDINIYSAKDFCKIPRSCVAFCVVQWKREQYNRHKDM